MVDRPPTTPGAAPLSPGVRDRPRRTWRERAQRNHGPDGFQIGDISRIFMRRMRRLFGGQTRARADPQQANNIRLTSPDSTRQQRSHVATASSSTSASTSTTASPTADDAAATTAGNDFMNGLIGLTMNENELDLAQLELIRLQKILELLDQQGSIFELEAAIIVLFSVQIACPETVDDVGQQQLEDMLGELVIAKMTMELSLISVRLHLLEMSGIRGRESDARELHVKALHHNMVLNTLMDQPRLLKQLAKTQKQQLLERIQRNSPLNTIVKEKEDIQFRINCQNFRIRCLKTRGEQFGKTTVDIARETILSDSFRLLDSLSVSALKKHLRVVFKGEDGQDLKGLAREWMIKLGNEITSPTTGLFEISDADKYTKQIKVSYGELSPEQLKNYELVGKVMGVALFHGILVDMQLLAPIFKFLLGQKFELEDLRETDAKLFTSLSWIVDNDPSSLELTFETDRIVDGLPRPFELVPGGANIQVNENNKHKYISDLLDFRYNFGLRAQMESIARGFHQFIPQETIQIFTAKQLELVLCGVASIDLDDWKEHTTYENGYSSDSAEIKWFWSIVDGFSVEMRSKLLQFTTGSNRLPASGFSALEGTSGPCRFSVFKYEKLPALPRGHACFNRLDLPVYKSLEQMRSSIMLALEHDTGFGVE